jgi:hypothetical protein
LIVHPFFMAYDGSFLSLTMVSRLQSLLDMKVFGWSGRKIGRIRFGGGVSFTESFVYWFFLLFLLLGLGSRFS